MRGVCFFNGRTQFGFSVPDGLFVLEEGEILLGQRLGKTGQEGDGLEVEALGLEQGDAFELFHIIAHRGDAMEGGFGDLGVFLSVQP